MKITSLKHAEQILHSFINDTSRLGDGQTLARMWPLLEAAGNPHKKLRVIHVAGTSGKTSTCYFIAEMLRRSGKKVGLTVSPHVDSITERVQINGRSIDDESFCHHLAQFLELIGDQKQSSYFEIMVVFILWEFVQSKVDYVVLETGMGGLLDGTNVVTRQDKVCVITDIGFDHMHVLGNTLTEIAAQKAGIIHENNAVFMHRQLPDVMQEIENRVKEKNAKLQVVLSEQVQGGNSTITELPVFQQRNWLLAQEAVYYVARRDGFPVVSPDPKSVVVPARMEQRLLENGDTLIMDGAHNAQKMQMFVMSFQAMFPGKKATVLLALKKGKEYEEVIKALEPILSSLVITTFTAFQDVPFTAQDPSVIAAFATERGVDTCVVSDYQAAYKKLLESTDSVKIITGSFYLLSQIRSL